MLSLGIQCAKAQVAVGLEWAHPQLISQSEGLLVVGFGVCGVQRSAIGSDLTDEVSHSAPCLLGL
jgi:hypothetical protein